MAALVSFLPEEQIGVVILTNLNESDVTFPLTANLFDRLLGIDPPHDYDPEYLARIRAREAAQEAHRSEPAPVPNTRPSLPLRAYAGVYHNRLFGTATVRLEPTGKLTVQYDANPTGIGDLTHESFDSFVATMRDPMLGKIPVSFRLDANGRVGSMLFAIDGPVEWVRSR
jgi:hypothetical protein